MLGFLIWLIVGGLFIVFGIYTYRSKKQKVFGFWSFGESFEVNDVKVYNHALGKLWIVFGILFALLGIPLLSGQNSPVVFISIIGAMFEAIGAMVIYITVIEKKYRKN
ncbi:hypothetical protein lbkm_1192 [Lachnospiraceae bacterium KM106-2]|nr:hypothetical protein lbkm_1192 [Lachnospiraceae bacterium KM106-2]